MSIKLCGEVTHLFIRHLNDPPEPNFTFNTFNMFQLGKFSIYIYCCIFVCRYKYLNEAKLETEFDFPKYGKNVIGRMRTGLSLIGRI